MLKFSEHAPLFALQDEVLARLQSIADPQLSLAKLCGGTALASCWLEHRLSYDLDFFFAEGFSAGKLAVALKTRGIEFDAKDIVDGPHQANQLRGDVLIEGKRLTVSTTKSAISA